MNMDIALSSSNSILTSKNYDVFLSFRGEDTRDTFTSHLYEALFRKGIKTYIDEDSLKRGEEISSALMKAIEDSKLSLIIFSENYASSTWCLDELLHILLCKEKNGQEVVPVFYRVDPSCVRKQKESYKKAFDNHEERFKDKMEKVHKWRHALEKAANLSGFSTQDIRPDSELVKKVVEDVLGKLKHITPNQDSEGLVGIQLPIMQIESLLLTGLSHVGIIGIWGMGGIGKTTLARLVFDRLSNQFDSCCFLLNVKEEWENGIKKYHLQSQLFSELLEEDRNMNFPFAGSTFNKNRLKGKKVLIVLDDINDDEQLEYLVGSRDWFGPGSRIIITSRDVQSIKDRVDETYEVKALHFDEALQLFNMNAFKGSYTATNCTEISERVVNYAEGNPLALKLLGSLFGSKRNERWESLFAGLKNSPNTHKIQNVLRKSYDELTDKQKDIFLDIVCFFNGAERRIVEEILEGSLCVNVIDDLVDKSLLIINYNRVYMHQLIRDMGQEIIRQQSIKEPGQRSRLWMAQDIYRIFKNNRASKKLEGMMLDVSQIKEVHLRPTVFEETSDLRLLIIYNSKHSSNITSCKVHLPQGLQSLPDTLRYLCWDGYPVKCLPSNFDPENLVCLIMPNSQLEQLWDGVQNLPNLKMIDLSYSKKLIQMPDLSQAPNLEQMNFRSCTSLRQVLSHSFENLDRLAHLDMSYCKSLTTLPDNFVSRSLVHLDLRGCQNLENIPGVNRNVVVYLDLSGTKIVDLPASFGYFNQLTELKIEFCHGLKDLTSSKICQLTFLRTLSLYGCSSLETIPELPRNLHKLDLSMTAIEQVPPSIEVLFDLQYFTMDFCKKLRSLPENICQLKSLRRLSLHKCSEFEKFPEILEPMEFLDEMHLYGTKIKELPSSIDNLVSLSILDMRYCENLHFVPSSFYNLEKLQGIDFRTYSILLKRADQNPMKFYTIALADYEMLEILDSFAGCLSCVRRLAIIGNDLDMIPAQSIHEFSNLRYLSLSNWKKLRSLPELPFTLQHLDAQGCTSLETVSPTSYSIVAQTQGELSYSRQERIFINCLKLDQNACNNIILDAQLRILGVAVHAWSKAYRRYSKTYPPNVYICYPGNEIPEWFIYQSKGHSINIKLSPCMEYWCESEFLGFSLCCVAAFKNYNCFRLGLQFLVEIRLKTDSGKIFGSKYTWQALNSYKSAAYPTIINSDHVFMSYELENFRGLEGVKQGSITEVSFQFYPRKADAVYGLSYVKSCGVRPLYREEAEKFGISVPKHWEIKLLETEYMVDDDDGDEE